MSDSEPWAIQHSFAARHDPGAETICQLWMRQPARFQIEVGSGRSAADISQASKRLALKVPDQ